MIEEAVFRLFEELATKSDHVAVGPRLAELGWSDIEAEYPVESCELLFRAQGRSLAHTDCLDRVMLAELTALLNEPADGIVLPNLADSCTPSSAEGQVAGIVVGCPRAAWWCRYQVLWARYR
ncbi:putative acyl-CoA dehydrogenase domain protein [Mycobacterium xenopi 3993]|nr:putative acyl-CoA dehydrogenase domain protein [Mycobacterium xenopi 3993]